MMKNVSRLACLFVITMLQTITLYAQANKDLAKTILSDARLDTVMAKARALLGKGFNAGDGYPQVWIRDFNTFIETSIEVYNRDSIRNNLLTFVKLQQPNGEIVDGYVLKGHVTWGDPNKYYSPLDTTRVGFKNTVETDQETSLVQAFGKYIRITNDSSILHEMIDDKTALERLGMAIDFLLKHRYSDKFKLLTGATTQDWGDVQVEGGAVVDIDSLTHWCSDVYDNAMFVIALNDMILFANNPADKKKWTELRDLTASNTKKYLWDKSMQKFIPHLYINGSPFPSSFDENKIYFHGGTAIAMEAGLLTKKEIEKANADMLNNVKLSGAPTVGLTLYPPYPQNIIPGSGANKEYNYQNGGDWEWFGGRIIQQLVANGFAKEAYDELQPMVDRVIKNGRFYEWYSRDNKPNGSDNFKGSAGVLAKAIVMLRDWAKQNQ
ncbi:hypothetical protein OCK74_20110 [Chitinophagaceae bacterium LB-8]|uniref:Glycosyl hydrolase 36 catalytic domain-containing protein n=1 Tax=Paraflavisolibacter caeni TaxID=2982496 RepID=A0A9X3BJN3_9BACT|nr:amylo-alpha-1,6-glucosidase [Paraflavisolibacter caeni]MCU7551438.1 hypothetical protein [Paraflavisolibacter caeni]